MSLVVTKKEEPTSTSKHDDETETEVEEYNRFVWKIIDEYFASHPAAYVQHHLDSYNHFLSQFIHQTFRERNPVIYQTEYDKDKGRYRHTCRLYFGGKDGTQIYVGKPVIYDKHREHYMFPNEARLRNMTYATTLHYDLHVEYEDILDDPTRPFPEALDITTTAAATTTLDWQPMQQPNPVENYTEEHEKRERKKGRQKKEVPVVPMQQEGAGPKKKPQQQMFLSAKETQNSPLQYRKHTIQRVFLGRLPMMVGSKYCMLHGMAPRMRMGVGECKNDNGGYFIIDGKEKCIVMQEKFADNVLYLRRYEEKEEEKAAPLFSFSAEIRSVSENVSKPVRTLRVGLVNPTASYSNGHIVVQVPNVRSPVPLFILFRALGILTDKAIVEMCLLDLDKYADMVDLLVPSVHDASHVMTQEDAVYYISLLLKHKSAKEVAKVLMDFLFPHMGEANMQEKALFLGHMVFRLLSVKTGLEPPTDRDHYKNKRMESTGPLL